MPLVQIMSVLYKKYPKCLRIQDFSKLLDIVTSIASQLGETPVTESIFDLCSVLIDYEEKSTNELETQNYWDKIWQTVLRYLSINFTSLLKF